MANQSKRKGRKTISQRTFYDEVPLAEEKKEQQLDALFQTFMKSKELEGLRERTLKDHSTHFRYFVSFLNNAYPSVKLGIDITTEMVRDYIYYMTKEKMLWDDHTSSAYKHIEKKGLSPVTVNVRLRTLKCFFKFLFDENYILINPTARIKLLKTKEDTIPSFSETQVQDLLKQPDQRSYAGFRDYVLMVTFIDTGIRCKEILGIEKKHFDEIQKTITIPSHLAKNGKERIVPLSQKTAKLIKILINESRAFEEPADNIFLSNFGEKLDASGIRERIKDYGDESDIRDVRVSPHTFRHTFAKFYILNGGDPFTLQRILGHSSMNMVRKYIQMNGEDIKSQHHQYSPIQHLMES
ncbi:tyrosine-type recombinase/integrase [Alkalihalobacillus sp. MEB130]|uniref:tyrosine-type recombinase/integrase n=1 Tax=Alkalihalobacillus sp. MEB130 TaxID=2976704 RepID=UPI0028E001BB|nr:tyrosine-type recombinase/integrase [Alkalihalobacillus sp. MEB130]MDT8860489.1 tyrosine-type recombinase/integrase [Alkalihalobacillus sp. MEB130]